LPTILFLSGGGGCIILCFRAQWGTFKSAIYPRRTRFFESDSGSRGNGIKLNYSSDEFSEIKDVQTGEIIRFVGQIKNLTVIKRNERRIQRGGIKMAIDPVCHMTVMKEGTSNFGLQGQEYYFCAKGCKIAFDKDPEKY